MAKKSKPKLKKLSLLEEAKRLEPKGTRLWVDKIESEETKNELLELKRAFLAEELGDLTTADLWRMLKKHGVSVAQSTFRHWMANIPGGS